VLHDRAREAVLVDLVETCLDQVFQLVDSPFSFDPGSHAMDYRRVAERL
jgi:hypothetical protein